MQTRPPPSLQIRKKIFQARKRKHWRFKLCWILGKADRQICVQIRVKGIQAILYSQFRQWWDPREINSKYLHASATTAVLIMQLREVYFTWKREKSQCLIRDAITSDANSHDHFLSLGLLWKSPLRRVAVCAKIIRDRWSGGFKGRESDSILKLQLSKKNTLSFFDKSRIASLQISRSRNWTLKIRYWINTEWSAPESTTSLLQVLHTSHSCNRALSKTVANLSEVIVCTLSSVHFLLSWNCREQMVKDECQRHRRVFQNLSCSTDCWEILFCS